MAVILLHRKTDDDTREDDKYISQDFEDVKAPVQLHTFDFGCAGTYAICGLHQAHWRG